MGLGGMPDLENVGILGNGPAQDDGVKIALVDKFAGKGRPFHSADVRLHANFGQLALNQRGRKNALLIALVGQDGEGQRAAVFLPQAVFFPHETRLVQHLFGLCHILGHGLQCLMIGP